MCFYMFILKRRILSSLTIISNSIPNIIPMRVTFGHIILPVFYFLLITLLNKATSRRGEMSLVSIAFLQLRKSYFKAM